MLSCFLRNPLSCVTHPSPRPCYMLELTLISSARNSFEVWLKQGRIFFFFLLWKNEVGAGVGAPSCAQGRAIFLLFLSEWDLVAEVILPSPLKPEEAAGRVHSKREKQTNPGNCTGCTKQEGVNTSSGRVSLVWNAQDQECWGGFGFGNICIVFTG